MQHSMCEYEPRVTDPYMSLEDEEQENDDACSNDPAQYEGVPPPPQVDPLNQAVDQWERVCTWSSMPVPTSDNTEWTLHMSTHAPNKVGQMARS